MSWPIPRAGAGLLINHISDTHVGYRPWSYAESRHMIDDYADGQIPDVDLSLWTGDITDDGADVEDAYALFMINRISQAARRRLLCMGNHDIRDRKDHTRAAWERVYGQAANTYVDVKGVRFVTFAPDSFTGNEVPWVVPDATWQWVDHVVSTAPGRVVLAEHYPPRELGVSSNNYLQPSAVLDTLVGDHPSIMGMMTGHMHINMGDSRMASFLEIGGRKIPVICDVSSMLSINDQARDVSGQYPSWSAFVIIEEGFWDVRYRNHGAHQWDGPSGARSTRMDLSTGTITYT